VTEFEARATARLDAHYREFQRLLGHAQRHAHSGRYEAAAGFGQIAGQLAWMNHTGLFASTELETLLADLGRDLPTGSSGRAAREPETILHVITQTYQTGGPTRALRCWLEQDSAHRHRVCITRQGMRPPPMDLALQVDHPGDLVRLEAGRGLLVDRARRLRELAEGCDLVLLHTHPHDVVPLIAFGHGPRPPVVYINHGDHVFWLGAGVANLVMNMRQSGRRLTITRRGVDPGRAVVMPRPLLPPEREVSRREAKRRLGLRQDQVLLVTAADAPKYRPVTRPGFLDLVLPVLRHRPQAMLIAAGPADEGAWRDAREQTGGRIRGVGRLPDVTLLHQAADVYLDSYPFASLTSLLEAGSFGTPAITYRGHPEGCEVLGADTPGVDDHLLCARDPHTFETLLGRAIDDADWRREVGELTQQAIVETHTEAGWRRAASELYRHAARTSAPPPMNDVERQTGELDRRVDAVMELTGYSEGPTGALRDQLTLLPGRERVVVGTRLVRERVNLRPRHVIPEWLQPPLGGVRERIQRRSASRTTRRDVAPDRVAVAVGTEVKLGVTADA
jgi:hypothetical protein